MEQTLSRVVTLVLTFMVGLAWTADEAAPGRLCKFFTDGTKKCTTHCTRNFDDSFWNKHMKGVPGVPDGAAPDSMPVGMEPFMGYVCTSKATSSKWTRNQGYLFDTKKGAAKFVGSCFFEESGDKDWSCRPCGRDPAAASDNYCFNGGMQMPNHKPWTWTKNDENTLSTGEHFDSNGFVLQDR